MLAELHVADGARARCCSRGSAADSRADVAAFRSAPAAAGGVSGPVPVSSPGPAHYPRSIAVINALKILWFIDLHLGGVKTNRLLVRLRPVAAHDTTVSVGPGPNERTYSFCVASDSF